MPTYTQDTVAILGATGHLGLRLSELWYLENRARIVPIVRSYASLARLARFDLKAHVTCCTDARSLAKALQGCDYLVHTATGNPSQIRALTEPVYRACEQAGIRRLVFISSAAVHGQNPCVSTHEGTPLPRWHTFPYNAAKAYAEKQFLKLRRQGGKTEVVILRPCIVYGPRFYWATDFIKSLKNGTAAWVDEGRGVFNGIYVDNLIHAIEQALIKPGDAQVFLVNDTTYTRWRDFLIPLAEAAGMQPGDIKDWKPEQCYSKAYAYWESLRGSSWVQKGVSLVPSWIKQGLKAGIQASLKGLTAHSGPRATLDIAHTGPQGYMSYEMELLQSTQWKLPNTKAQELLDYNPPYTFEQGMAGTLAWLRFAHYTKA